MNKSNFRHLVFLLLLCFLLCLHGTVSAEAFMLYVGSAQETTSELSQAGVPLDSVKLYKRDGKWYLFLPAAWNCDELSVYFTGTETISIAGESGIENGHSDKAKSKSNRA